MENETIQPDVSGEVAEVEQLEPETSSEAFSNDPVAKRERKLAEIAEKRRAEIKVERDGAAEIDGPFSEQVQSPPEAVSTDNEDNDPIGEEEDPDSAQVAPDAQEKPATPTNGWTENDDGTRTKTLMVNGQPKEISEEQYDRMLQKDLAGDQKLRMASEMDTQLNERARLLEAREKQLAQPQALPDQGVNEELAAVISSYQDALLDGDTDVAATKMAQIVNMGRESSTPNIDAIVSQATTQMREQDQQARYQASVDTGWTKFQAEYEDVLADPDAMAFADIQIKKLRSAGDGKSPEDILLEAGNITRKRLGLTGGDDSQDSGDSDVVDLRAERKSRKANLKPIPKAGGPKHKPNEAPKLDMSPEAKIGRMRTARFK